LLSQLQYLPVHVEAEGTTRAAVDAVWALVSDANTYAKWVPWNDGGANLQPRDPPSQGPSNGSASVDAQRPSTPSRIVYAVVRGIPVKDYRAEVTLAPIVPNGTSIRWAATWDNTLMGRIVHRKLQAVYRRVMGSRCGQRQPTSN
jgi:hypothetical protein